jgi:DNA ligase-1
MKAFAQLFYDLDQTNKTNEKVDILVRYLRNASDEDIMWMLGLFTGRRPKRVVNSTFLRLWAAEYAKVPLWMLEECYSIVGDFSETMALLMPPPQHPTERSLGYWIRFVSDLDKKTEEERKAAIFDAWDQLTPQEKFVFNKITSSTFRVGVSQTLVVRALSLHTKIPQNVLTHRLMGKWHPATLSYQEMIATGSNKDEMSRPYPFCLAYALEGEPADLGEPAEWSAEWKWDGIRSQIIVRSGNIYIWSRGEDLVTDRFPELEVMKSLLPDGTVIDGEILPYSNNHVLSFNVLQTRIGRKNLTPKILKEAPVAVFAYDLLEWEGNDIREKPFAERRMLLEALVNKVNFKPYLQLSPQIPFTEWNELSHQRTLARELSSEGIMLKRQSSHYGVGRKKGDWWKWKIDPLSIDAVMIYAARGTGRRANLYTDYTFAVWNGEQLVSFAKAYSGLTDKEILEVDRWIKKNTIEKFGPVRTVKPELVFEIGFEGIQRSSRHKSGIALRFPRILRWRTDKPKEEADSLETLWQILETYEKK